MAFHATVPSRAELLEVVRGILPAPSQYAGREITLEHYRIPAQYADAGAEHIRFTVQGEKPRRYSYSGRNTAHAAKQVAQLKAALAAECWSPLGYRRGTLAQATLVREATV